jgi:translocator protein
MITMTAMNGWYESLEQPEWNPPDQVFGPVWTLLYAAMAISAWLVWRSQDRTVWRFPLVVWWLQLALNLLWTALFFGLQMPGVALAGIVALLAAITATIIAFWSVSRIAAAMLVPYLGWVAFAAALNYSIWSSN